MKAFPAVLRICVVAVGVAQAHATIGGTASDATGAMVPGVRITALNVNTGISLKVVANESGNYPFASLQPDLFKRNIMDLAANRPAVIATGANNAYATLAGTQRSQGRRR